MMQSNPSTPPIAFIIFNRPKVSQSVFETIKQARPAQLFVIADGPRLEREGEAAKCAKTRSIINQVDWNCEVFRCFSDENLGCGKRIATGLSWVFEHVEEAVILEDDCVADPTFFHFCHEMLARYRHDSRVMSISGGCRFTKSLNQESYYFSKYLNCWGWATWRRAWEHFDFSMSGLPEKLEQDWLFKHLGSRKIANIWRQKFEIAHESGRADIWSYQFQFACWLQNGLSVRSNSNLIANLGFGEDSTHTQANQDALPATLFLNRERMRFPLIHPEQVKVDQQADNAIDRAIIARVDPSFTARVYRKLKLLIYMLSRVWNNRLHYK